MAEIRLKVEPSKLKEKAGEMTELLSKLQGDYEGLKHEADTTQGSWNGEAADTFRSYVREIDKEMREVLQRLSEHPDHLLEMAGIYEQSEKEMLDYTSILPSNVIE